MLPGRAAHESMAAAKQSALELERIKQYPGEQQAQRRVRVLVPRGEAIPRPAACREAQKTW